MWIQIKGPLFRAVSTPWMLSAWTTSTRWTFKSCLNHCHRKHIRGDHHDLIQWCWSWWKLRLQNSSISSASFDICYQSDILQDISPSFYHVQKPKAFLRPIITNLGNECIDPNISAENRQRSVQWILSLLLLYYYNFILFCIIRSVQWITTELRKQTAR